MTEFKSGDKVTVKFRARIDEDELGLWAEYRAPSGKRVGVLLADLPVGTKVSPRRPPLSVGGVVPVGRLGELPSKSVVATQGQAFMVNSDGHWFALNFTGHVQMDSYQGGGPFILLRLGDGRDGAAS